MPTSLIETAAILAGKVHFGDQGPAPAGVIFRPGVKGSPLVLPERGTHRTGHDKLAAFREKFGVSDHRFGRLLRPRPCREENGGREKSRRKTGHVFRGIIGSGEKRWRLTASGA